MLLALVKFRTSTQFYSTFVVLVLAALWMGLLPGRGLVTAIPAFGLLAVSAWVILGARAYGRERRAGAKLALADNSDVPVAKEEQSFVKVVGMGFTDRFLEIRTKHMITFGRLCSGRRVHDDTDLRFSFIWRAYLHPETGDHHRDYANKPITITQSDNPPRVASDGTWIFGGDDPYEPSFVCTVHAPQSPRALRLRQLCKNLNLIPRS
jgi:hypothetical protein